MLIIFMRRISESTNANGSDRFGYRQKSMVHLRRPRRAATPKKKRRASPKRRTLIKEGMFYGERNMDALDVLTTRTAYRIPDGRGPGRPQPPTGRPAVPSSSRCSPCVSSPRLDALPCLSLVYGPRAMPCPAATLSFHLS